MSRLLREAFKREEISITHEMIDFQNNDYIVNTLDETFQEIINEINSSKKFKKSSDLHKDAKTLQLINKIEYSIKERFGLDVKLVAMDYSFNMCVWPNSPKDLDAIAESDNDAVLEELQRIVTRSGMTEAKAKTKENIQTYDENTYVSMCYRYRKSLLAIREKMKTSSVFIDTKKAKIIGLPTDTFSFLGHDIVSFVKEAKINSRELIGIVLHEIGHLFTFIEYSYRSVTNTSVLIDTFLDNLNKKNKTPKQSLILAYEKVSNDTNTEYKTKDATSVAIYVVDSFLKENRFTITGSTHSSVDAEQLADQFSGRFGVGSELVTALEKIIKFNKDFLTNARVANFICTILFAMVTVMWISIGYMASAIFAGLAAILYLFGFLTCSYPGDYENNPGYINTYDETKRRYARIRNDIIRNLRTNGLASKEQMKAIISRLDQLDRIIASVPDAKVPLFDKLVRLISSSAKHRLEIRNIERLIEDLSENNLYLASAKLQTKL